MNKSLLAFLCVATMGLSAHAQDCPDTGPYKEARAVLQDLGRVVAPSGIQESYKTKIGGIDQWLNVRGQDQANPVILFVHGGPAAPLMPSIWQFQRPIEEYFTVVNWDQRGAGKTYREVNPNSIGDSIHISRYVDDAIEVAEYVRTRYHKRKLILMGHSWGTIVGLSAAMKRPDLFHAYVGIGQVINTKENERLSFAYALAQAKAHENAPALKELESIAPYPGNAPITRERIVLARKWAQFYGGLSAYRETSRYYFRAPFMSPEYDADDSCAIDKGSLFTLEKILPEFLNVAFDRVESFPLPVVMFMGQHDYTTPSAPTAAWLQNVKAPYKQGVVFEHSAHMVPWEEPGKLLVSLLKYVHPLAVDANGKEN